MLVVCFSLKNIFETQLNLREMDKLKVKHACRLIKKICNYRKMTHETLIKNKKSTPLVSFATKLCTCLKL